MPHTGHRQRMRSRFRQDAGGLCDHELLELILYSTLPRVNTNEIAHALLHRFGSLRGVLSAEEGELRRIPGIGENAAVFLRAVSELFARCEREICLTSDLLSSPGRLGRYLQSLFFGVSEERSRMLLFDGARRLISCESLEGGVPLESAISVRRIVQRVLDCGAAYVILAHNHPEGIVFVSDADRKATGVVKDCLQNIGVTLLDHMIVTPERCIPILHPEKSGELSMES